MRGQQPADAAEKKPLEGDASMKEIWAAAARAFEDICKESLQNGAVKSFDEVQRKIESASNVSYDTDAEQKDKWEKAKTVGLKSLKYLKMLVGAASQASSFIPIPASAASITSNALSFVFSIPEAIKGYNDAVDQVFREVSSALSQFQIYTSMDSVDPVLIRQIHLVLVSFVKICAHVVKYRQGGKWVRLLRQAKSVFDNDSGLGDEMAEFKRVLQQQRDVEGTVTLAVAVETRRDLAVLLEQFVVFGKTTGETHQAVQETQKGVQALKDDADRIKTLIKIRDTLGVQATVRLDSNTTQTCTKIYNRCLDDTGSWIWTHDAYATWAAPGKDKDASSYVLVVSGPPSSGKTSAVALITKRLEEQKGRTYVAHYFFPASTKKSDEEKHPVQSALKYMAFQIARVDPTVRNALGKACEAGPGAFRPSSSLETLDALWGELKIGVPGSGAAYTLVFDGLENLPEKQAEMLLAFVFGPKPAGGSAGRLRVLVSGTDEQFADRNGGGGELRIRMEEHNGPDMRAVIDGALTKRGMLQHARPGSDQQRARDKILEKLPQKVGGSYSRLQLGLDDVIRLLSTRSAVRELDCMLDQSMNSHEVAIENLRRSLTADEISELNELLKWVLFSSQPMTLDQLEAAMFLYSGTESLASLQYIIRNKYSAVLKLEDDYVIGQDGVKEYLQKEKDTSSKLLHSKDRATISMTITINNVDQELCGHFLWDLAHKAILEKFNFNFDAASMGGAHGGGGVQAAIAVDEFEAHHTIVIRGFKYLAEEQRDQTKEIGKYLTCWLPYHLGQLRQLEDDDKGALTPSEQSDIGQNLYRLFKDDAVFRRHQESFEPTWWEVDEIKDVQKWLMDSAVVRRLDRRWRDEVRLSTSPTRGFLRELVKLIVEGFLRERTWKVQSAYNWIEEFMAVDDEKSQQVPNAEADDAKSSLAGSDAGSASSVDWDRVSSWCQGILGLPDSALDSLWYERLAEASSLEGSKADTVLSLYQRAINKKNPSWLCRRGLGTAHFDQGRTQEAIVQVELALQEAEREEAAPKPEAKDIADLHLLLGEFAYEAGNVEEAAKHYLIACGSEDEQQARLGRLGHLKARLAQPDLEETRRWLNDTLSGDDGERTMAGVLKMVARDAEHDVLVSNMFIVARGDPGLLKGIVRAMEIATATSPPNDECAAELTGDDRFAENEACGVLLYDLGVAAYWYNAWADGTKSVGEALRLWRESRDLLANVGGRNAFIARKHATSALARHYFQSMVDGNHMDHMEALTKLAEADSNIYRSDSIGFLGALHALRGDKVQARAVLKRRIVQALQILSDDVVENDAYGFSTIQETLGQFQDFGNAAIALSLLGQPDLVTSALRFEAEDIVEEEGVSKQLVLEIATKLARETIEAARAGVPEPSQQMKRIESAGAYLDSLEPAGADETKVDGGDRAGGPEGSLEEGEPAESAAARRLLQSRLSALRQMHTPDINVSAFQWRWSCDGRTPDGKHCGKMADCEHEFYHCTYCSNRDFCRDCLAHLRNPPSTGAKMTICSPEHRWLRIPPQGIDMYVGERATKVQVPRVRPMEGDKSILEIYYEGNGGEEEITVEAWKAALAKDWDIALEDLEKEMSRQSTPVAGKEGIMEEDEE